MIKLTRPATRRLLSAAGAALALGGLGVAVASPSMTTKAGRGVDGFGKTDGAIAGTASDFTYTKGFYCDTSVSSAAPSRCEAGASFKKPPAKQFDDLFITVPLGFTVPATKLECPDKLVCIDHPGTIDLSRLEPALKPLYPTLTDAQLTAALKSYATPGHDHFITDLNNGKPEWWDVQVVGVTSKTTFAAIKQHGSYKYIKSLIDAKDPNVVGPVPTNLFLFFASTHHH